jgi:hypothetical protein
MKLLDVAPKTHELYYEIQIVEHCHDEDPSEIAQMLCRSTKNVSVEDFKNDLEEKKFDDRDSYDRLVASLEKEAPHLIV